MRRRPPKTPGNFVSSPRTPIGEEIDGLYPPDSPAPHNCHLRGMMSRDNAKTERKPTNGSEEVAEISERKQKLSETESKLKIDQQKLSRFPPEASLAFVGV